MISLRRRTLRYEDRGCQQLTWLTFHQAADLALEQGFGSLVLLDEVRLPPAVALRIPPHSPTELITYLREGTLAYQSSLGPVRWLRAGEFRCRADASDDRGGARNASETEHAHVFQIGFRSVAERPRRDQQHHYTVAERRGKWCLVASAGGRGAWLNLCEDAQVYSAVLDSGQHVVHALRTGRRAWLHVIRGEIWLHDMVLSSGDSAGITADRSVPVTSIDSAELLLIDLV